MSAIPKPVSHQYTKSNGTAAVDHAAFLKLLPAVESQAAVRFGHLHPTDREEAVAEAKAAAYLNYASTCKRARSHVVTPGTLARYAVLHVQNGKHVGSRKDRGADVLSPAAQRKHGFRVVSLPIRDGYAYDCMTAPDQPVWRDHLLHDRGTPPPDQAAFRIDWSRFLAGQTDRTRTAVAMLAAGHRQTEVAEHLGVTPAAICQRLNKAKREWEAWQRVESDAAAPANS